MPSNSEVCDVVVGRPETRVTVLYRLCRQRAVRENERERFARPKSRNLHNNANR
jgi:hypothetical protein